MISSILIGTIPCPYKAISSGEGLSFQPLAASIIMAFATSLFKPSMSIRYDNLRAIHGAANDVPATFAAPRGSHTLMYCSSLPP